MTELEVTEHLQEHFNDKSSCGLFQPGCKSAFGMEVDFKPLEDELCSQLDGGISSLLML